MKLNAIGIVSSDIKKTIHFYKLLGLNLEQFEDSEHYEGVSESGLRIMADSEELMQKVYPGFKKPEKSSLTLGFELNSAKEVNNKYSEIIDNGFASLTEPWDAFWGQRYARVEDPDGNPIDLFAAQ